jgi:hypothetical protein
MGGILKLAAILAAVAVSTETGRTYLKKALKVGMELGYQAKDKAEDLGRKAIEYKDELVAEIESESGEKGKS